MVGVAGIFAVVAFAFMQVAGGADYYSRLSASVDLQNHGPQGIQERTLIDKSNRGQKLKDAILSFQKLAAQGEIGPLQLGMTMDQVVAVLGLPPEVWWNHLGESRFDYPGWVLSFQSNDFTPKVPSPGSCIFVCIDHITGLPIIWPG